MIDMLRQPGHNVIDNETLYRLLQVDGAYADMVLRNRVLEPYLRTTTELVKLMRSYNPELPMGAGMRAQFETLMKELEDGGRSGHGTAPAGGDGGGSVGTSPEGGGKDPSGGGGGLRLVR